MTHLDSTWKFRLPQLPLGKDGLHSGSKGPIKKPHPRLIRHPSHHFFFFAGASNGLHTSNIYQHLKMLLDDLLISCKQPSSMNNHTHICNYIILIPLYIYVYLSLSLVFCLRPIVADQTRASDVELRILCHIRHMPWGTCPIESVLSVTVPPKKV
jgi:hypothetical protein